MLIVVGLLVYWNGLSGPFLFDDQNSILNNTRIRELWPPSIPLSPPRDTPVAGRPIVNLSFAVNYAIGGLDVRGYHLVNLAIHLLASLTLFGVVRRSLLLAPYRAGPGSPRRTPPPQRAGVRSGGPGPAPWGGGVRGGDPAVQGVASRLAEASTNLAWVCALVWMIHPLQTESVNYLSERTESMMGLFYLLTLYCSIRAHERPTTRWHVAAVVACAAGMACKESMVTAPVMVVLYDRVFVFNSFKASMRARSGFYAGLAAGWLVLAALMSSTPRTSVGFGAGTTPWVYLLNQSELIVRYLRLTVWPRALVLDYGLPRPLMLRDVLPQAVLVAGLGLAVLVALARRPQLGFLGAWFFITLAPTTSIVPIATEVGAERRMYLPLAGLIVLAVVGWHLICTHAARAFTAREADRKGPPRILAIVAATVACALLATGTVLRNREYQSRLSIAQTVVERWPSGRAHYLVAVELLRAGRRSEAMAELRASARDYPDARYALGTELFADGMLDAAIQELRAFVRALPTHPNAVRAHDQLGRAFLAQGRIDEAMEQFNVVLAQPDYPLRWEVVAFVERIRTARRGL